MYGFHPANLFFRFLLEMVALVAIGVGAYTLADGILAWILAIGAPLIAAAAWGTFNVPGDRSRSGKAPVPVRGAIRLALELLFFLAAVLLLRLVSPVTAVTLGVAVVLHYAFSIDRIRWLLSS